MRPAQKLNFLPIKSEFLGKVPWGKASEGRALVQRFPGPTVTVRILRREQGHSQAAEKLNFASVLKGHGFSRANKANKMNGL
jgi:hypothetical protein